MTANEVSWVAALWGSLWADNSVLGRVIVLAIAGLTGTALRAVLVHRRRYRRESAVLTVLAEKLQPRQAASAGAGDSSGREDAVEAPVDAATPAVVGTPLIDIAGLKEAVPAGSLVWERLSSIQALRAHRVRVDVGTLQELTAAREQSRPGLGLPGFAGGLCMLLGVFGTFVGLAVMVQHLHLGLPTSADEFTYDAWTHSIRNLKTVLGGMKTAFSTSVVGMAGAIVCTVADSRLRQAKAAFLERFERFTVEDLLPAIVPAVEDESLLERVTFQLEESFERRESIYEQNCSALADLAGVEEACAQIVREVREVTRSEAARDLQAVVEQLKATNRAILEVVEQLPRLVVATERTGRDLVAQVGQFSTTLSSRSAAGLARASLVRLLIGGVVAAAIVFGLLELLK